eukprot:TRINITY_DN14219_c0_g1_i1.p1 TRINITY_DN14219_c0_g1~~TRINITY_DN14219_c0_g1_i1.p1  ORF type:complete len:210 (+),score=43.93 TRINITY_DN14219_c0_g1_i1:29-631(+)
MNSAQYFFVLVLCLALLCFAAADKNCHNYDNCTVVADHQPLLISGPMVSGCSDSPFGSICFEQNTQDNSGSVSFGEKKIAFDEVPECLDDATLLDILDHTPALKNYTKLIHDIYDVVGCIPSGLFSVCYTQNPEGCRVQTVELLYFEQFCVYKGVTTFDCPPSPPPTAAEIVQVEAKGAIRDNLAKVRNALENLVKKHKQ